MNQTLQPKSRISERGTMEGKNDKTYIWYFGLVDDLLTLFVKIVLRFTLGTSLLNHFILEGSPIRLIHTSGVGTFLFSITFEII